jgi:hypothetical protein
VTILLPEKSKTTEEMKARCLDFAHRMIFKGYQNLTDARRKKLWEEAEYFITMCLDNGSYDWDQTRGGYGYACDYFHEHFDEQFFPDTERWDKKFEKGIQPKFLDTLEFICRAAIDLFDDWAGGCWGWTIGGFKRMYDGQLPDWFPKDGWHILFDGNIAFSEMTDETAIAV